MVHITPTMLRCSLSLTHSSHLLTHTVSARCPMQVLGWEGEEVKEKVDLPKLYRTGNPHHLTAGYIHKYFHLLFFF